MISLPSCRSSTHSKSCHSKSCQLSHEKAEGNGVKPFTGVWVFVGPWSLLLAPPSWCQLLSWALPPPSLHTLPKGVTCPGPPPRHHLGAWQASHSSQHMAPSAAAGHICVFFWFSCSSLHFPACLSDWIYEVKVFWINGKVQHCLKGNMGHPEFTHSLLHCYTFFVQPNSWSLSPKSPSFLLFKGAECRYSLALLTSGTKKSPKLLNPSDSFSDKPQQSPSSSNKLMGYLCSWA